MPIGNKPSLSPDTGLRTPHSWVGFMAEGKFIIVGWLGDQLSTCTYSCHQSPLCFPCDSFMSGTIATGLGCAHAEVPLQTEFKAPLALGWIRRHFLFCCLPADPGLAKTGRNFPPGHAGSRELLLECVQVGNTLWVRSLDHSSGLPEGAKILSEVRPTSQCRCQKRSEKNEKYVSSCMKQNSFIESVVIIQGLVQLFASLRNLFWYSKWISMALFNDIWYLPNPVIFLKSPFFCKITMTEFRACTWV